MTEEQETQRLLRAGWAQIPAGVAPVSDLIRAGKRAKRQRRGFRVTGVAAAVTLVMTGGYLLSTHVDISSSPGTAAATPSSSEVEAVTPTPSEAPTPTESPSEGPQTPEAPSGSRIVGMGRVVVTVPEGWATEIGGCVDLPLRDTVFFPAKVMLTCADARPPDTSSLRFYDSNSPSIEGLVAEAEPAGSVNGLAVARIPTEVSGGIAEGVLVIPSESLLVWVDSPKPETVDEVLASVTLLPEGFVAVPSAEGPWPATREKIEEVGLAVAAVEERRSRWPGGKLIQTRPAVGTVVSVGSTVTLVVAGEGKTGISPDPPANVVRSFRFDLFTHCGVRYAFFAGRTWATPLLSDGRHNPPRGWEDPTQPGRIYLLANGEAIFTSPGHRDLRYHPTRAELGECN